MPENTTARVVVRAMGGVGAVVVCMSVDALIPKLVDVGGSGLASCGVTSSSASASPLHITIERPTRQASAENEILFTNNRIHAQLPHTSPSPQKPRESAIVKLQPRW
jgi:hypothetical protein